MLLQLSSSHDNGQSMVIYPWGLNHDPSVVILHHNGQSMVRYPKGMNHASSVVIVSCQRSTHGYSSKMYETCSFSRHRCLTTDRAWLYIPKVWTMLIQWSSSLDDGQSMVIYHSCMKHAPSVAIVQWQRTEHGYISRRYESCSTSCHRLMTTVRAWLFFHKVWKMLRQSSSWLDNGQSMEYIIHVWNMLRQFSSSHDNGQSIVIHTLGTNHAPSIVIISWQRSEHSNISFMWGICSVSCHRLMTRSEHCNISFMYKHAPSFFIFSWQRTEHC